VLDKAEYSAFESTLTLQSFVSYKNSCYILVASLSYDQSNLFKETGELFGICWK